MQTFLPYNNFERCAEVLDNKRLYKQIVECKQILQTLEKIKQRSEDVLGYYTPFAKQPNEPKIPWENHPAVLMWQGFEKGLRCYQLVMLNEWLTRRWDVELDDEDYKVYKKHLPDWLGDERLHKSHRTMLFWKDPEHYSPFFNDYLEVVDLDHNDLEELNDKETRLLISAHKPEYYWPSKEGYR